MEEEEQEPEQLRLALEIQQIVILKCQPIDHFILLGFIFIVNNNIMSRSIDHFPLHLQLFDVLIEFLSKPVSPDCAGQRDSAQRTPV